MSNTLNKSKTKEGVALAAFFKLVEKWELTAEQQRTLLGSIPSSTFYKYKSNPQGAVLGTDIIDRISYVLGIHMDLQMLFSDKQFVYQWIKRPNKGAPFSGRCPLDVMCQGHIVDLHTVRQYLAAQRGV